jgi:hypothetical protein
MLTQPRASTTRLRSATRRACTPREPLYKRSLAIWEKVLGAEHPNVATSLENYPPLLRKTGRDSGAKHSEARAAAIRKKQRWGDPERPLPAGFSRSGQRPETKAKRAIADTVATRGATARPTSLLASTRHLPKAIEIDLPTASGDELIGAFRARS